MSGTTTGDAQRHTNRPDTEAGDGTSARRELLRELRRGRTGLEQAGAQPPTAARPATAERSRWQRTADSFIARLREAQAERLAATDPGIARLFYAVVAFNLLIIGVALLRGPECVAGDPPSWAVAE